MPEEAPTAAEVRGLVERAQKGDREALEELYLMHFDRIYSYLQMTVGNRHDAEDLTNQTFVKMLDRNGKKDLVRDAITRVLRQSVGVKFEVEESAESEENVSAPRPGTRSPQVSAPVSPPVKVVPVAPPAPTVKVTPELIESIRSAEPLVKALMDELGAQIVKVEREGA